MHLQPRHPPVRNVRKVRAFAAEIHRLQAEGYTCDEIREALAEVGVVVSRSTVQREAARVAQRMTKTATTASLVTTPAIPSTAREPAAPSLRPRADDPRTPRQIAEDFMKGQVTNPLLRPERTP